MPVDNSLNTAKGRLFQQQVRQALTKQYGIEFIVDYPIAIGDPPKQNKFDLVSMKHKHIVECKNFSWTETGNIPDAKMAKCDQALLYLSHAPAIAKKILVMRRDAHSSKRETLAQYYKRTHQHLLGEIIVMEFNSESGQLTEI